MNKVKPTDFAYALSDYFFNYLKVQKGLSENTIQSYNDAISIFLEYCEREQHIRREKIEIRHLNRELVESFYEWLETEKGNAATTRNLRRAAINEAEKNFYNLNTVNNFHSFIKARYGFYRGVATKYLNRYNALFTLAWRQGGSLIAGLCAKFFHPGTTDYHHGLRDVWEKGLLVL